MKFICPMTNSGLVWTLVHHSFIKRRFKQIHGTGRLLLDRRERIDVIQWKQAEIEEEEKEEEEEEEEEKQGTRWPRRVVKILRDIDDEDEKK